MEEKMETYKQEPITQRQVEGLIGGTVSAYNGLLLLDGENFSRSYQAGNFTGVSKVTVNNAGRLDKIVDNLIGMTMSLAIPEIYVNAKSDVFNENTDLSEVDAFYKVYDGKLGQAEKSIAQLVGNERTRQKKKVESFKNAMIELNESYKTNDVQKVADAVEKISNVAIWGTIVPVKPLYDAAGSMKEIAFFNGALGFDNAVPVYRSLSNAMNDAQVKETHKFLGVPYKMLAPPNGSQVYRGTLDHEFIATDLMRQH